MSLWRRAASRRVAVRNARRTRHRCAALPWRSLSIELLERRSLLSVTTQLALDGSGNLTITDVDGGDTDDALVLATDATDLTVTDTNGNLIGVTGLAPDDYSGDGTSEVRVKLVAAGWTGGILVDTLAGDDTIRAEGVDLGRSADLAIDAGAGSDAVVFDTAATNTRGGNLDVTAAQITVSAAVSTGGGGSSFSATGDVTFGSLVDTAGGNLSVHADSDGDGIGTFLLVPAAGVFQEQAALHASDAQAYDYFGGSVCVSGDTAIVGAYEEDGGAGDPLSDSGAAYAFTRNPDGTWTEQAVLRASDAQGWDDFGRSVCISGDTAIVGAPDEDGGAGDPAYSSGAAYVFTRDAGGTWTEQAVLRASDAQTADQFGWSVSISGDTAVVGAPHESGGAGDPVTNSGAAYVFSRDGGGTWTEQAVLRASDAQRDDEFGWSVSISGDTVVAGAQGEDGGAGDPAALSGAAYVFSRDGGGTWTEQAVLRASDAQAYDYFGRSVSISGDAAVLGAYGEDGGPGAPASNSGAAYVFRRDGGGTWSEQTVLRAFDAQAGDGFGWSVSIAGDRAIVGAAAEDGGAGNPAGSSGSAYVFSRDGGGTWTEQSVLRASDAQAYDQFGWSVSVSDEAAIVGAVYEDGGAGDPADESGAAYVFRPDDGAASSSGGDVSIAAADVELGGSVDAGAGTVGFTPSTAGRTFDLGATGGTGQIILTDEELDQVTTTNRIVVGDAGTGDVTFTGAVDLTGNTPELEIHSDGAAARIGDANTTEPDAVVPQLTLSATRPPVTLSTPGDVTLSDGAAFTVEIGGTTPGNTDGDHDQVSATGSLTIGANVVLAASSWNGFLPAIGDSFTIIRRSGGSGAFAGLAEGATIGDFLGSGLRAVITYTGGDGHDVVLTTIAAEVVDRSVFYNNSAFDGNDPAANVQDDDAIAPDKQPLLPGQTADFQNYTSYTKGLNGIMVDILGSPGTPTAADFEFKMGNDESPDAWTLAPDPSITVRPGEGEGGSDRVTLLWPDYDTVNPDPTTQAVAKQWLQVTVKATANTGLAEPDVFYFGSAVGESGLGNFGGAALVNAVDSGAVRDNPHNPFVDPAPIDDFVDYNRDEWVNAVDFGFVRDNATNPTTALQLITAPSAAPLPGPEEASAPARFERAALHDAALGELSTQPEDGTRAHVQPPELPWLDGSDSSGAEGRSSRMADPTKAAVERLLATL